jgi:uncharacterized protein YndB with AHSA1/START domain
MTAAVMTDDLFLSLDRRFAAPVAQVFRLWSDPVLRQKWWGPAGFTCTELHSDFRPGGAWGATIIARDLGPYGMAGVYREIAAGERIVFSFRWTTDAEPEETEVTVTFRPTADGGTLQRFRQGPFSAPASRDSHSEGWSECLDRLVGAADGRP